MAKYEGYKGAFHNICISAGNYKYKQKQMDMINELIEKEKPKVVEHIDNARGFCSNCGTLVYKNEIYCNRCGHKQDWSTS